jgi:hypothetical protein
MGHDEPCANVSPHKLCPLQGEQIIGAPFVGHNRCFSPNLNLSVLYARTSALT